MASSFNQNLPSGLAVFNWSSAATCEGHKERITGIFHYMSAVLIWWFYATGQTKDLTELNKYISDDNMSALTITTNHIQKMLLLGASCMNFISFRKNVSEQPLWQSYYNVISIYCNSYDKFLTCTSVVEPNNDFLSFLCCVALLVHGTLTRA